MTSFDTSELGFPHSRVILVRVKLDNRVNHVTNTAILISINSKALHSTNLCIVHVLFS